MSEGPDQGFKVYGELMMRLSIVSQLFSTRMGKRLAPLRLTVSQYGILNHLARMQLERQRVEGLRISEIASAVEVNQPAVTKTVAKFEELGWVKVKGDPDDLRSRNVIMTEAGLKALAQSRNLFKSDMVSWRSEWPPQEAEEVATMLARIGKWLDKNRL